MHDQTERKKRSEVVNIIKNKTEMKHIYDITEHSAAI